MRYLFAIIVPVLLLSYQYMYGQQDWKELLTLSTLVEMITAFILIGRSAEFLCISFGTRDKYIEFMIAIFTGYALAKYLQKSSFELTPPLRTPIRRVVLTNPAEEPEEPEEHEEPEGDVYPPPVNEVNEVNEANEANEVNEVDEALEAQLKNNVA
jgi:hypothetical protein